MKTGGRLARIAAREAADHVDREVEIFVRAQMKPELVAAAKRAMSASKSESFGLSSKESTNGEQEKVR